MSERNLWSAVINQVRSDLLFYLEDKPLTKYTSNAVSEVTRKDLLSAIYFVKEELEYVVSLTDLDEKIIPYFVELVEKVEAKQNEHLRIPEPNIKENGTENFWSASSGYWARENENKLERIRSRWFETRSDYCTRQPQKKLGFRVEKMGIRRGFDD